MTARHKENPSTAKRDVPRKAVDALALIKREPMSAYKVEVTLKMRRETATRILAYAAERGLLTIVGRTRRGAPVYGWHKPWE